MASSSSIPTAPNSLRLAFLGAGKVNFGGGPGPWDHASRLERLPGVQVVGIADPLEGAAQRALAARRAGPYAQVYDGCGLYKNLEELLEEGKPEVVVVGIPPYTRGSLQNDVELKCVQAGVHVFVEKPVSLASVEEFRKYVKEVEKARQETGAVISVGYMFRYHKAIRKMKDILESHGRPVMALSLNYTSAYKHDSNVYWWDVRRSGGPIVEQATHLCDVARYLAGDVLEDTVQTLTVRDQGPASAGHLSCVPKDCDVGLPEDARAPRVTMAHWRFTRGGLGSLTHAIALHDRKYEASVEVLADGLRLFLEDLYTRHCRLRVRMSGSEQEVVYTFPDDDPYQTEIKDFLQAVRTGDTATIASTYSDATGTYSLTWAIRNAEGI